jgi:hypothetical protein
LCFKVLTAAEKLAGTAKKSILTKCSENDTLLDSAKTPRADC